MKAATAFSVAPVITQAAADAFPLVLAKAGCVIPARDPVDARLAHETATGTVTHTGSRGGLADIIDSQTDVGGWPLLAAGTPPQDSDGDGMPDAWELANGLDPADPADRNLTDSNGHTRLENYLNSLAATAFPIPQISAQPEAATVPAGVGFSLSVTVSGAAPFSYQWFKGGEQIPGETAFSLEDEAADPGDQNLYHVRITNPYGTVISQSVLVTVDDPAAPSIVAQPAAAEATSGEPLTLHAAATGTGPLVYQWHRCSGQAVHGATTASLVISPLAISDAGLYHLTVSSPYGSVTSAPARVTVRVPLTSTTAFSTLFAGNTIHSPVPGLTSSTTNWHFMSSKNATASNIATSPPALILTMPVTSSGIVEAAALIADPPLDISLTNSTIKTRITFTPVNIRTLSLGLFNSGGVTPHNGLINSLLVNSSATYATGGTSGWRGYRTAIFENSTTYVIDARPPQPTANNTSQALIVPGTSSSFQNVVNASTVIPPAPSFGFSDDQVHTLNTELLRSSPGTYFLSWKLQSGTEPIASGAVTTTEAAATPQAVASLFDAVAIGYRNRDNSVTSKLTVHELELITGTHTLVADPYEAFLHARGLDPLAAGAFDQDPDGNGTPNGIEFILGSSSSRHLPALTGNPGTGWTFSFSRTANATEAAEIVIERSSDLIGWQALADVQSSLTPMENDMLLKTIEIPAGSGSLYFRLKATRKKP